MLYIEVESGKIKSIYSGKMPSDEKDYRTVPMAFPGTVGQDIREFTTDWELRPLEERLRDALISDADRYKAVGEELVPKTLPELVRDGVELAPEGMKLDLTGGGCGLVAMTPDELVAAGLMMAEEKAAQDLATCIANRRNAYREESDPLFFDYQRGGATKEQWLSRIAEIKARYPKPGK